MEYINKVEIKGFVGTAKTETVLDKKICKLSVATNYAYKSRDGMAVIDTTWWNVTASKGGKIKQLPEITKGDAVHVLGRMQMKRYTDAAGNERTLYEVVASELEIIESK